MWSCLKKTTWTDNKSVVLPFQNSAGKSQTIIGAIGAYLNRKAEQFCFIFDVIDKTNGDTVQQFLRLLINQLPAPVEEVTLYLDQSKVHQSNKIKDFGVTHGLELVLTPRYSCCLNPIEHVWALIKRRWATRLAATTEDLRKVDLKPMIAEVCDEIGETLKPNIMRASDKYMDRVL